MSAILNTFCVFYCFRRIIYTSKTRELRVTDQPCALHMKLTLRLRMKLAEMHMSFLEKD